METSSWLALKENTARLFWMLLLSCETMYYVWLARYVRSNARRMVADTDGASERYSFVHGYQLHVSDI